jgi:hypothetical protein
MENALIKEPIPSGKAGAPRRLLLPFLAILIMILLAAAFYALWGLPGRAGEGAEAVESSQAAFEAKTGVRVVHLALSAGGGLLDLRYLVIDPDKAAAVHDLDNPLAVMDERNAKTFDTPWMDHSHQREFHAGVIYYTLLMNSGGALQKGDKVTVIIGGERLENVVIQ